MMPVLYPTEKQSGGTFKTPQAMPSLPGPKKSVWPKPANDNWPKPANDNAKLGPWGRPRPPSGRPIGVGNNGSTIDAAGVVRQIKKGAYQRVIDAVVPVMGHPLNVDTFPHGVGKYWWCANPAGFGPLWYSSIIYPVGSPGAACIAQQAIGVPSPSPLPNGQQGAWRWSNEDQTRYAHVWSMQGAVYSPLTNAQILPGPQIKGNLAPASLPLSKPPPPGTKEKKFLITINPYSALGISLNGITEAIDWAEALFYALPAHIRRRYGDNPQSWVQAIYENWGSMDWGKAGVNIIRMQLTDYIFGSIGKKLGQASAKTGHYGYGVGPAL